ncbi:MAG: LemA family protein, partial [Patescibacteria group bacterium]
MDQTLLIVIGALALIIVWGVVLFNSLIAHRNRVDESWSDIDVQLKRRYDLIPNLVEAVKGYMQHERGTLEAVTQARAAAMNAQSVQEHAQA